MADHHARHFRNKTANTVLIIPTRARKYRTSLYIFDFLLTWLGLTCIGVAIVCLTLRNKLFFPAWLFGVLLSVGFIVIIVGFLGGRGASVSFEKLRNGYANLWLITVCYIYTLLLIYLR